MHMTAQCTQDNGKTTLNKEFRNTKDKLSSLPFCLVLMQV
jgi:hypothetical protein